MNRSSSVIGTLGAAMAAGGLILYSLFPQELWIVTLMEGVGLSGLIVFVVFRLQTLKDFSTRRSTRLGANSVLMVLLFTGILFLVNFLAARHARQWDLSETQEFTLAPQTHQILRNLPREVQVTVFAQDRTPSAQRYRDLLELYRRDTDKLRVSYVDPDRQPDLARQYGITRADTAVLESGTQSTQVTAPSEAELTGALIRVSKDVRKRILFLEDHGEHALADDQRGGLSLAKEALSKQGYDVATLSLLRQASVPESAAVLVLAGPRRSVTAEEQERMRQYVAGGGRLLLMLDPDTETRLDNLLKQWGLELGRGVLVDLQDRLAQGALTALLISTFTQHEITQDFRLPVLLPDARYLAFDAQAGKDWDFVPLARTSPRSWAETNLQGRVASFNEKEDVQGPLPVAAALTPKASAPEGKRAAAIVVVGNSAFATNAYVNFPGNTDFLLHAVGWLAEERDLVSITPKEPAFRPFIPNPTQERLLLYVQVLFLPAMTFLWGMSIWRRRRRL